METHIRLEPKKSLTVADWAAQNRRHLVVALSSLVAVILVVVVGYVIFNARSAKADEAFGDAMRTYDVAVVAPGTPSAPGVKTYPTAEARAKDANAAFTAVADQYGSTESGKNAKYMAGVTAAEAGQTATAESTLKDVAGSWNADRSSLANLALAQLYIHTGRESDAIAIFEKLTKKPSTAVPAGLAQLQLASLYESQNKPAEAKKIYAQLKDKEKDSPIGELASQKLSGKTDQ